MGRKRGRGNFGGQSEQENTVDQLLVEMDGECHGHSLKAQQRNRVLVQHPRGDSQSSFRGPSALSWSQQARTRCTYMHPVLFYISILTSILLCIGDKIILTKKMGKMMNKRANVCLILKVEYGSETLQKPRCNEM